MLRWNVETETEGVTIPYGPMFEGVRMNRGFVDTRGRPDLAERISECTQSSEMKNLLVRVAQPGSDIFSVGCDLGNKNIAEEGLPAYTAGGYIHLMSKGYACQAPDDYVRYAEAVAELMEEGSNDHEWYLDLLLTLVQFNLDEYNDIAASILIWFHAFGDTESEAGLEREECIARLCYCLLQEQSLRCFE